MKTSPILFSTPMVQAILEDRKTQTRRVVKPQPVNVVMDTDGNHGEDYGGGVTFLKPPHSPGDILWVRETWLDDGSDHGNIHYKASATDADLVWLKENGHKWRPSIFMPRAAARIFLRATDVRVERVRDISEEDAIAEGIPECSGHKAGDDCCCASLAYSALWDELNAKRGYGWEANPWVWVYAFERITKEEAEKDA